MKKKTKKSGPTLVPVDGLILVRGLAWAEDIDYEALGGKLYIRRKCVLAGDHPIHKGDVVHYVPSVCDGLGLSFFQVVADRDYDTGELIPGCP